MKINSKKKSFIDEGRIPSLIIIAMVIFNFIAPLFTVARGGVEFLSGGEFYYSNGYTLALSGYPAALEGVGAWLRIYSAAHLIFSAALLVFVGIFILVKRTLCGVGTFAVISSASLSALYMIHGIIAYSTARDFAGLYYDCQSYSFIPFIISAILTAGFFYTKYKLKNAE